MKKAPAAAPFPEPEDEHDCPHCGRCRHCGRGNQMQPIYVPYQPWYPAVPYYPNYPYWGTYTIGGNTTPTVTGTTTNVNGFLSGTVTFNA